MGANKDSSRPDHTLRNFSHGVLKGIYGGRSSAGHQMGRAVGLDKPFLCGRGYDASLRIDSQWSSIVYVCCLSAEWLCISFM